MASRKFSQGSQCDRVLKYLQSGPKTTAQLQRKCGKYTQRISDLRAAQYVIIAHDLGGGLWKYVLMGKTK